MYTQVHRYPTVQKNSERTSPHHPASQRKNIYDKEELRTRTVSIPNIKPNELPG
jgi:hypothetical protein